MTNPNFYPANIQWLGFAKETTPGTPVAAPTIWVPVDTPVWKPNVQILKDGALRGSMAVDYNQQQGLRYDTVQFKTYFYLDSVYFLFRSLLGTTDTLTGSADPYTHKTSLYNGSGSDAAQPVSSTVFLADGAGKVWQMSYAIPSTVKYTVGPDALASIDATFVGLAATAITPPSNTPTTNRPLPSWNSTITLGGVGQLKYSSVEIEYKRATEMIPTVTGSQNPFAIFGGPVSATGTLTGVYQGSTDTDLTNFFANTQPSLTVKLAPQGDATHYIAFQHSMVAYDGAEVSGTNKWMEIKSTITPLANATDGLAGLSPVQVQMLSPISTAI